MAQDPNEQRGEHPPRLLNKKAVAKAFSVILVMGATSNIIGNFDDTKRLVENVANAVTDMANAVTTVARTMTGIVSDAFIMTEPPDASRPESLAIVMPGPGKVPPRISGPPLPHGDPPGIPEFNVEGYWHGFSPSVPGHRFSVIFFRSGMIYILLPFGAEPLTGVYDTMVRGGEIDMSLRSFGSSTYKKVKARYKVVSPNDMILKIAGVPTLELMRAVPPEGHPVPAAGPSRSRFQPSS